MRLSLYLKMQVIPFEFVQLLAPFEFNFTLYLLYPLTRAKILMCLLMPQWRVSLETLARPASVQTDVRTFSFALMAPVSVKH
jgi:hypothetical protein